MFIQKDTCAWVRVSERPVLITWLREQRCPNGTQPPLAWRTSLQDSLASSHGQIPLVLRGQRAKPWPVFGTAEKHKNCLWVSLFPRDLYPCSASPPHHCQAHSLYSQFLQVFWLTKLAWPRGNEAFLFVLYNHASVFLVLSPQRRCGCWILWLPPTTLWSSHGEQCLNGMEEQQEFKPSHSVVSQASDACSSMVLKRP